MKDLQKLTTYPEFYALKSELIQFVDKLKEELMELDVGNAQFGFEAGVRVESIKQVEGLLTKLGMVSDQDLTKKRKTYE